MYVWDKDNLSCTYVQILYGVMFRYMSRQIDKPNANNSICTNFLVICRTTNKNSRECHVQMSIGLVGLLDLLNNELYCPLDGTVENKYKGRQAGRVVLPWKKKGLPHEFEVTGGNDDIK